MHDSLGLVKNEPQYAGTGAPADAADLTEVAAYAALVGNRKVGTTAQRTATTGTAEAWDGLLWGDTTDGFEYKYKSGAWVGGITAFSFAGLYVDKGGVYETVKAVVQAGFGRLEGVVSNNAAATFNADTVYTIGTIPATIAPAKTEMFAASWGTTGSAIVYVDATGTVTFILATGAASVAAGNFILSLSGISWRKQ